MIAKLKAQISEFVVVKVGRSYFRKRNCLYIFGPLILICLIWLLLCRNSPQIENAAPEKAAPLVMLEVFQPPEALACGHGFIQFNGTCVDLNECGQDHSYCDENFTCRNNPGSFECICNHGFELVDDDCYDVDECSSNTTCPTTSRCINTKGSFQSRSHNT